MATYNKRNNSNNHFRNRQKIYSPIQKVSKTHREQTNTTTEKNHTAEIGKGTDRPKWTDIAMVLITLALAIYTYKLFDVAADQTEISKQNIALAQKSAKEAQRSADAAENAILFAKQSTKSSDSISAMNFNLSKQLKALLTITST